MEEMIKRLTVFGTLVFLSVIIEKARFFVHAPGYDEYET